MKTIDIEHFKGIVADIEYKPIIDEYARKAMKILRNVSPRSGRQGRKTPYWQGWEVMEKHIPHGYSDSVWNRTNWQLTHLLENGHFITNQGAISWSAPRKHIRPTYLEIRDPYIRAMKKAKIEADFK